jgi:hypothetical protein
LPGMFIMQPEASAFIMAQSQLAMLVSPSCRPRRGRARAGRLRSK